ncbi:MAG: hypothetical protein ACO1OQ_12525 [Rufibacter sp.]
MFKERTWLGKESAAIVGDNTNNPEAVAIPLARESAQQGEQFRVFL